MAARSGHAQVASPSLGADILQVLMFKVIMQHITRDA
jgi:hypothetical protein